LGETPLKSAVGTYKGRSHRRGLSRSRILLPRSTSSTRANANILTSWPVAATSGGLQALAFFGGLFYALENSDVSAFDTATSTTTSLGAAHIDITGAGQSTCVPPTPTDGGAPDETMTPTLHVLDSKVVITVRGEGEPVLFLHGNPDTKEVWDGAIDIVSKSRQCFAPDLPGFGGSEIPPGHDFSLEAQAQWVEAVVVAAKIEKPVTLVVHDLGGPHGCAWLVKHPERVSRIVFTNAAFSPKFEWHFWARVWRTPLLGELTMAVWNWPLYRSEMKKARKASEGEIRESFDRITPRMKRGVLDWYRKMDPEVFEGWSDKLVAIVKQKPAAVRWGDRDPYVPKRFAESFGATDVKHFPENGHWLLQERPDVIADAVLSTYRNHD